MKISEADILLVPGHGAMPAGHWMHRWCEKMPTARLVEMPAPFHPLRKAWVEAIAGAVAAAERPVVLVAHALGAIACVHAARSLDRDKVRAAFLVAPTDLARSAQKPDLAVGDFLPVPSGPLPFKARVVASRTDPHCDQDTAKHFAHDWGAHFQDAGDAGHIDPESGHGPWPEGLMSFAYLMKDL